MTAPRHHSRSAACAGVSISRGYACIELTALDRTREQTAHEITLQGEEHDERHDDGDEGRCRENLPVAAARTEQIVELCRQDELIGVCAQEHHGDQKVVPHPEELKDREGGKNGKRKGQHDLHEYLEVARAVDA